MSEVKRLLDEHVMRQAEKRVEDESYEEYLKKQQEEHLRELEEAEKGFRNDLIRELRVMNRLKAIEILETGRINSLGNNYTFLRNIETQWVGEFEPPVEDYPTDPNA